MFLDCHEITLLFLIGLFVKYLLIDRYLFGRERQFVCTAYLYAWSVRLVYFHDLCYNKIMSIAHIQIKSLEHLLAKRQQIANNNTLPVGLPDAAAYYYFKQASFLSKKEEKWNFYFFQGLNTNPQNLSIYLRDEASRQNKNSKQKLIKGVFMVADIFNKSDVVVEINIPGNLKIYKLQQGKKQVVSNQQMDLMYLSSAFRSMYQQNLPWGRYYHLFHDSKNYVTDLKSFFIILFRSTQKKDINIGAQFESQSQVKGSHSCSLIFNYLKDRRLVGYAIQIIQELFSKNEEYRTCVKFNILLAELYTFFKKYSKCLQLISHLLKQHPNQPFLLYYQAKYLILVQKNELALLVANSIVQFNQFQIWLLLAEIHLKLSNFGDLLICLNHAIKLAKLKSLKNLDIIYKGFQEIGKLKFVASFDSIELFPKLLISCDNPLSIQVKQVQQKNKFLIQKGYWRLNSNEKLIYNIVQSLRYRLQSKKFEWLLLNTFQENITKFQTINIKKGLMNGSSEEIISQRLIANETTGTFRQELEEQLPDFLKNSSQKIEESVNVKQSRNLSIIQQIESVIENSNYEEREKQKVVKPARYKRQVQQGLFKIVQLIMGQNDFQKAEFQNNLAKILQVYNKMRATSKYNNYYADCMFKIFMQTTNYNSIIVLIAETLDLLEQKGVKKIDKLPYWMHKYLFFIIEEKGLNFLNQTLERLNFFDEAVIDTIQIAKSWKLKGVGY